MPRVCVFSRESGPLIKQWPADDMPPRLTLHGREYRRYRLSRLVSTHEVDEAVIYSSCAFTPADEMLIFHTLFPGAGGIFQIELAPATEPRAAIAPALGGPPEVRGL